MGRGERERVKKREQRDEESENKQPPFKHEERKEFCDLYYYH